MKNTLIILLLTLAVSLFSTSIYDIQYTDDAGDGTYPSTMIDEEVTITGIVSGTNYGDTKFFVCDLPEVGVGAWHGMYIFNIDENQTPQLGDKVEITGTVTEYYGFTELGYVTVTVLSSGNEVPAPTAVTTLNLAVPAQAEAYESCLVEVNDVTVTEEQGQYGEWYITDGSGECQVDDGFFYLDEVDPAIVISVDDTWARIIGIVDYSYDNYGLNPRFPDDLISELSTPVNQVSAVAQLKGNYPNPFNPNTTISYSLNEASNVTVEIFDVKGAKVKTLVNSVKTVGEHSENWNGTTDEGKPATSGIYFVKLKTDREVQTKKMMLMK